MYLRTNFIGSVVGGFFRRCYFLATAPYSLTPLVASGPKRFSVGPQPLQRMIVGASVVPMAPCNVRFCEVVKRHPELLTGRHEELTPMVLADVKQAASERALK